MEKDYRREFMLHLYDKLWMDTEITIKMLWQTILIFFGALATLVLTKYQLSTSNLFFPLNMTYTAMILAIMWMLGHIINSSYWFNRNLAMITNIEKQFLNKKDEKLIHYYFLSPRPFKMLPYFKLQFIFILIVGILLILYHFFNFFLPLYKELNFCSLLVKSVIFPYYIGIAGTIFLFLLHKAGENKYNEFNIKSPGESFGNEKQISTKYGHGESFFS